MANNNKKQANFQGNNDLKELIIYYVYNKNVNWVLVEAAISNIETVDEEAASDIFGSLVPDDFITINETSYPENFKEALLPPLCLFAWGNKGLLENEEVITSLWGDITIDDMLQAQLPLDKTYAMIVNNTNIDNIKKIVKKGYTVIMVANTDYDFMLINALTTKYTNALFISEVPPDILSPDLDVDQTNEKLLYGIGRDQILMSSDVSIFKNVSALLSPSGIKPIYATEINRLSAEEVTQFDMVAYKKRTN